MRFVVVVPGSLILLMLVAVIGAGRGTPEPQTLYPEPEGVKEFLRRGELYEDVGEYEKALSDYEQATRLEPDNSNTYLGQGAVLSALDQPAAAIEQYLIVKEIDQQNGISTRIVEDLIAIEKAKL